MMLQINTIYRGWLLVSGIIYVYAAEFKEAVNVGFKLGRLRLNVADTKVHTAFDNLCRYIAVVVVGSF